MRLVKTLISVFSFLTLVTSCGLGQKDVSSMGESRPVWSAGRENEENLTLYFRAEVETRNVKTCRILLAASNDYRLTVNGEFVAHGPCVAAHGFYRIDDYDIAPYMRRGRNVIGIQVAHYGVPNYYLIDQPGFLQARVVLNGRDAALTGRDFRAYDLGQRKRDVVRFSNQRTFVEDYTIDKDYMSWAEDPLWEEQGLQILEAVPQKSLIPRGVLTPDYRVHEAVHKGASVYKFDTNSSGFLGLDVKAVDTVRLTVKFDELVGADGRVHPERWRCASTVEWNLSPGEYTLESFEPYTMQYAEVSVKGGECEVKKVWMRDYCNRDVHGGTFESSDNDLNRIFEAGRETIRQNSLDIFMDCASRERAGWLCDSYFSGRTANDLSGNTLVERNFLENFLLPDHFEGLPDGMFPMCYPSDHFNYKNTPDWNGRYIPNWAMWLVAELEEYLYRSSDREMVDAMKDKVYALVKFFEGYENPDGLLEKLDSWVFVEWSDANSFVQDVNYPTNMLYAYMLDVVSRLYDDPMMHQKCEKIRSVIRSQSYDGRFFCDNSLRGKDGKLVRTRNHSEACQYYAFYLGTATPELYPRLWAVLRDQFGPSRKQDNRYPDVGFANAFIGNYLRLECLSREGLCGQILDETKDFFLPMVEQTGTLWENMTSTASCNHGFASHLVHVLYRDVLGLYDVDRGGKKLTLRFLDTGIDKCRGTMPVPGGEISLSWEKNDGKIRYEVKTPAGYEVLVDQSSLPNEKIL